jgi:phenylalanyl-tRNA synthetase alpha chain
MLDKNITEIKESFSVDIKSVSSVKDVEEIRLKYFSRNGFVAQLFEKLKDASKEDKPELGKKLNLFRNDLTSQFDEVKIISSTQQA